MMSRRSSEQDVAKGLSVGIVCTESRAVIWVNLPASREEGAVLDAGLLRIAQFIR